MTGRQILLASDVLETIQPWHMHPMGNLRAIGGLVDIDPCTLIVKSKHWFKSKKENASQGDAVNSTQIKRIIDINIYGEQAKHLNAWIMVMFINLCANACYYHGLVGYFRFLVDGRTKDCFAATTTAI